MMFVLWTCRTYRENCRILFDEELEAPRLLCGSFRDNVFISQTYRHDKDELLAELEQIRSRGYAIDDEECENGVRCIAASVRDYTGKIIASISVSGPVNRMTFKKMDSVKEYVKEAAKQLSQQLGYE